jgi:hypothetical protein
MISFHFLGSAYGCGLLIISTALGGIATGSALADPEVIFSQINEIGSFYYIGRSIAWVMIFIAHMIFGLHFLLMLLRIGQPGGEPTLFASAEEPH